MKRKNSENGENTALVYANKRVQFNRGPGCQGLGKPAKIKESKQKQLEELEKPKKKVIFVDEEEEEEEVLHCLGCDEEVEDCCCQRCPVCDKINPEGQRHVFCLPTCTERIQFTEGFINYTD
jgi:hypothetical protein